MNPFSLLSWNIQVGRNGGLFANGWPARKDRVIEQISTISPALICLQEPLWEQLTQIRQSLKEFDYVGIGRDDGKRGGEFCPILIDRGKFAIEASGTFWLSDEPEFWHKTWDFPFKRICTWAKLRERESDTAFAVFNSHFPLTPGAHEKAAGLIARKKVELCESLPSIITADFNCDPNLIPAKSFKPLGMRNCATDLRKEKELTMTLSGKPVVCIDGVFASDSFCVSSYEVLEQSAEVLASDHFAIAVSMFISKGNHY